MTAIVIFADLHSSHEPGGDDICDSLYDSIVTAYLHSSQEPGGEAEPGSDTPHTWPAPCQ